MLDFEASPIGNVCLFIVQVSKLAKQFQRQAREGYLNTETPQFHPSPPIHRHSSIAIHPLPSIHCHPSIAIHPSPSIHRHPSIVKRKPPQATILISQNISHAIERSDNSY